MPAGGVAVADGVGGVGTAMEADILTPGAHVAHVAGGADRGVHAAIAAAPTLAVGLSRAVRSAAVNTCTISCRD